MSIIGLVIFYSVIPAILFLFTVLPPRRAAVVATISSWLFLPVARISLPGLPDYTKISALGVGLLLATICFAPSRLVRLRFRWFDIPVTVWCLSALASSISNGLGIYDGLASLNFELANWGLPYLIGRAHFSDDEGLTELAIGIIVGGMIYVPLCLFEIRMSPQLHKLAYGFHARDSMGADTRYGGYRPWVFMDTGLELGMYMAATSLLAYSFWATGIIRKIWKWPTRLVFIMLSATTVLCKSTGAIVLMVVGVGSLWAAKRIGTQRLLWVLVIAAPLYIGVRTTRVWDPEPFAKFVGETIGEDRAQSFEFRMGNENALMDKAFQRPMLGWGGWSRSHVFSEDGNDTNTTDGYWIYAFGTHGFVGLISFTLIQILPLGIYLWKRADQPWYRPENAATAGLAVLLALYSIDNLMNAMISPIYVLAAGGLMGLGGSSRKQAKSASEDSAGAARLTALGRDLKNQERPLEAAAAWRRALGLLSTAKPTPGTRRALANLHNDLAWLLCRDPSSAAYDPVAAAVSARAALEADPQHPAAWNTLGVALYRAGDFSGAILALERSVQRAGGKGDAFDAFPLAIAYHKVGNVPRAEQHLEYAMSWMRAHAPSHPELLLLSGEAQLASAGARS